MNNKANKILRLMSVAILFVALISLGKGGYIYAKAHLAQYLIASAWHAQQNGQDKVKPWPWADTYPVASLNLAGDTFYVLSGASGRNLAFGPAHISHSALPGEQGNMVIAGHRDTHFSKLRNLNMGDTIQVAGEHNWQQYQVTQIEVVHQIDTHWLQDSEASLLTLITCYPFDSSEPEPQLRYIIRAIAV